MLRCSLPSDSQLEEARRIRGTWGSKVSGRKENRLVATYDSLIILLFNN